MSAPPARDGTSCAAPGSRPGGALILSAAAPWAGWIERAVAAAAEQGAVPGQRIAVRIAGQHAGYVVVPQPAQSTRGWSGMVTPVPSAARTPTAEQMLARTGPAMTVEFGTGMSKAWFDWVAGRLNGKAATQDGALVFLDGSQRVQNQKRFGGATIVEVTLPELNAASRDPATVTAKMMLMSSSIQAGDQSEYKPKPPAAKPWLRSNFRLQIGGLPTTRVKRIEAMTFKFPPPGPAPANGGTGVTLPALAVTIDAQDLKAFSDWYQKVVVQGNNAASELPAGQLDWLTLDATGAPTVLGSLRFWELQPYELKRPIHTNNTDQLSDFEINMHFARVEASFAGMV